MTLKRKTTGIGAALLLTALAGTAFASPESDAVKASGVPATLKIATVTIPKSWKPGQQPSDSNTAFSFADPELTRKRNRFCVTTSTSYAPTEATLYKRLATNAKLSGAYGVEKIVVAGSPAYVTVLPSGDRRPDGTPYANIRIGGAWPANGKVETFTIEFFMSTLDFKKSFTEAYNKGELEDPEVQAVLETLAFTDPKVNQFFAERLAEAKAADKKETAILAKLSEFEKADVPETPETVLLGEWEADASTLVFNADGSVTVKNAWKVADGKPVITMPAALTYDNGELFSTGEGAKVTYAKPLSPEAAAGSNEAIVGVWNMKGALLRSQPMDAAKTAYYFPEQALKIQFLPNGSVKTGSAYSGVWEKDGDGYKVSVVKGAFKGLPFAFDGEKLLCSRSDAVKILYGK